jgi:hypothetical protein
MANTTENEWSKDQQGQITTLYNALKGELKTEAYAKVFGVPQLPYIHAFNILKGLANKQNKKSDETATKGLESRVTGTPVSGGIFAGRESHIRGLAAIAALMIGGPYVVPYFI